MNVVRIKNLVPTHGFSQMEIPELTFSQNSVLPKSPKTRNLFSRTTFFQTVIIFEIKNVKKIKNMIITKSYSNVFSVYYILYL